MRGAELNYEGHDVRVIIVDPEHVSLAKRFLDVSQQLHHGRMGRYSPDSMVSRAWNENALRLLTEFSDLGNQLSILNNSAIETCGYAREEMAFEWTVENECLLLQLRLRFTHERKPRLVWVNPMRDIMGKRYL